MKVKMLIINAFWGSNPCTSTSGYRDYKRCVVGNTDALRGSSQIPTTKTLTHVTILSQVSKNALKPSKGSKRCVEGLTHMLGSLPFWYTPKVFDRLKS